MKHLSILMVWLLLFPSLGGKTYKWTNIQGKTIQAEFVSSTDKLVTLSMQGKTFEVELSELAPHSMALAAKLRDQNLIPSNRDTGLPMKKSFQDEKDSAQDRINQLEREIVTLKAEISGKEALLYAELNKLGKGFRVSSSELFLGGAGDERRLWRWNNNNKPFTGTSYSLNPEGIIANETSYANGVRHGVTTSYFSGEKGAVKHYANGKLHGVSIDYSWINGKKMKASETQFVRGVKHSVINYSTADGSKRSEIVWENGKKILEKSWDKDGNLTNEKRF